MANQRGWWTLEYHGVDDEDEPFKVDDNDLEHIAACVKEGYTSGEIVKYDEDYE